MKDFDTYTEKEREELLEELEKTKVLIASGYAGLNKQGITVDRRIYPDAVAFQGNKSLGIPKPKKLSGLIQIKHGYVSYLAIYEIVAYISRVTVNNGQHSWQRIFKTFDKEEYKTKLDELLGSGCYEEF